VITTGGQTKRVTLPAAEPAKLQPEARYGQPDGGTVQAGYLHPNTVSHSWHQSMLSLMAYDANSHARLLRTAGPMMMRADTGALVEARNDVIAAFLDGTEHDWLWFVDTDMGFSADTVDRLVAAAEQAGGGAVGALCFGWRELEHDGMGGRRAIPVPTLFQLASEPDGTLGFAVQWDYPRSQLVQVAGTGAGCLLLHRELLMKIRAAYGDYWCDRVKYANGSVISEDLSLCYRIGSVGEPLYVDTRIKTTHHKQLWVSETDYEPVAESLVAIAAAERVRAEAERDRIAATMAQFGGDSA
jgi:hypothetical protein